jgi:hypothetical protein
MPLDPPIHLVDVEHDLSPDAATRQALRTPGLDRTGRDAEVFGQGILAEETTRLNLRLNLIVDKVA